jgi:hypothetical protein
VNHAPLCSQGPWQSSCLPEEEADRDQETVQPFRDVHDDPSQGAEHEGAGRLHEPHGYSAVACGWKCQGTSSVKTLRLPLRIRKSNPSCNDQDP